jgi:molecular chaperone DnaK
VHVREEFLTQADGQPVHLELEVTRRRFESLIEPLLESTLALTRRAIDEARLEGQRLSRVCLVGGSTRVPRVRALLEKSLGVEVHEEIDPDLAVGLGAAIQAGLLTGERLERLLVDVSAHSLGIRVFGQGDELLAVPETFAPVIRRNSVLPATRAEEFYTMMPQQPLIAVEVFQGEAPRVPDNTRVGAFEFPLEPCPANSPVRVEFSYDLNGVVKVSVSQPGTDNEKTVALSVADAGKALQQARPAATSPLVRKVRELLGRLEPQARTRMEELLSTYTAASGAEREQAEEALLDLYLEHEARAGEED